MSGTLETIDQLVGPTAIAYVAGETIGTANYILAMTGVSAVIGGVGGYALSEVNQIACEKDPRFCGFGVFGDVSQTDMIVGGMLIGGVAGALSGFTYSKLAEAASDIIKK